MRKLVFLKQPPRNALTKVKASGRTIIVPKGAHRYGPTYPPGPDGGLP